MDKNTQIKSMADRILYGFNLYDHLHTYGKAHIIGSYKMDIMAVNDLDIDIENDKMSLEKLHNLGAYVFNTINPSWFECKETINQKGEKEWFLGFEKEIRNEKINVDIWFLSKEKIEQTESFCEEVVKRLTAESRLATMEIKQQLDSEGLYGNKYCSLDVYDAVINKGIMNYSQFKERYRK